MIKTAEREWPPQSPAEAGVSSKDGSLVPASSLKISPVIPKACSLGTRLVPLSPRSWLKCHLLSEAFSDLPLKLTPPAPIHYSLIVFPTTHHRQTFILPVGDHSAPYSKVFADNHFCVWYLIGISLAWDTPWVPGKHLLNNEWMNEFMNAWVWDLIPWNASKEQGIGLPQSSWSVNASVLVLLGP